MIYLKLPTGDHGWGVVGDNLSAALGRLATVQRLGEAQAPHTLAGPLLQNVNAQLLADARFTTSHRVAYAVFEEQLSARRAAPDATERFAAVATACQWCEAVLRDAGMRHVKTILHGVDLERFNPARATRPDHRNRFVVFSGGKFEFRKGQDIVARAFQVFSQRHDDVVLKIAWHNGWKRFAQTMCDSPYFPLASSDYGSFEDLLSAWLVTTGLPADRIERVPHLPNSEMAAIYAGTDVGLFPNRCEGATNLVMMEYMACGRPVIATDFSGHRDILTARNSYRLSSATALDIRRKHETVATWREPDLDEIVDALEWAYDHRESLEMMGRQAATDLSALTWERAAREFLPLLASSS